MNKRRFNSWQIPFTTGKSDSLHRTSWNQAILSAIFLLEELHRRHNHPSLGMRGDLASDLTFCSLLSRRKKRHRAPTKLKPLLAGKNFRYFRWRDRCRTLTPRSRRSNERFLILRARAIYELFLTLYLEKSRDLVELSWTQWDWSILAMKLLYFVDVDIIHICFNI
jgi:hypothetical protein